MEFLSPQRFRYFYNFQEKVFGNIDERCEKKV